MANQEQLRLLTKSVTKWNQWREENPEIIPDLQNADLSYLDLSHANLSHANLTAAVGFQTILSAANLSHTLLMNADLSKADLGYANLSYAQLINVYLVKTNLVDANLQNTNLTNSYLTGANLKGANLETADLSGADLTATQFDDTKETDIVLEKYDISQEGIAVKSQNIAEISATVVQVIKEVFNRQKLGLTVEDLVNYFHEEHLSCFSLSEQLESLESLWVRTQLEALYQAS